MADTLEALFHKWKQGDEAAGERVITMMYAELRRLAAHYFRDERAGHTLQPTALVNEVFLKLFSGERVQWQDRSHLVAVAARQMRLILIDHARGRKALKRDDAQIPISALLRANSKPQFENILTVDEALKDLENLDARASQVVELRVFGGLNESEIATALSISVATVKRDWTFARAWLIKRLRD